MVVAQRSQLPHRARFAQMKLAQREHQLTRGLGVFDGRVQRRYVLCAAAWQLRVLFFTNRLF